MTSTEPYSILGINKSASSAQIRKAYREMARKYHPDKLDIPQAKQLFHTITLAYEMLSDPNKKRQYDELQSKRQQQNSKKSKDHKPDITREKTERRRQMSEQKLYQQQSTNRNKQFYFKQSKQFEDVNQYFKDYCKKNTNFKTKSTYFNSSPSKFQQSQNHESKKKYKARKNSSEAVAAGNTLFLVIFIFIFWYFMPRFSLDPQFTLVRSERYSLKLKTNRLKIPFFVKPLSPNSQNTRKISEERIQQAYLHNLQVTCEKNLSLKSLLQSRIAHVTNELQRKQIMNKFNSVDLKTCKKLIKIMRNHPQVKLKKFVNKIFT